MSEDHKPLPILSGYTPKWKIDAVNENRALEERILRRLDNWKGMGSSPDNAQNIDQRWLAHGRMLLEDAFMAINRAIFIPQRGKLPEDGA